MCNMNSTINKVSVSFSVIIVIAISILLYGLLNCIMDTGVDRYESVFYLIYSIKIYHILVIPSTAILLFKGTVFLKLWSSLTVVSLGISYLFVHNNFMFLGVLFTVISLITLGGYYFYYCLYQN